MSIKIDIVDVEKCENYKRNAREIRRVKEEDFYQPLLIEYSIHISYIDQSPNFL